MKHSIKTIFLNLKAFLLIATLAITMITLLIIEQNISYAKVENLNNQKQIISTLTSIDKNDIDLAIIQFNGKSTQLLNETEKLQDLDKYNITSEYIFGQKENYFKDLDTLKTLTIAFNKDALAYYSEENKDTKLTKQNLEKSFEQINAQIDSIIFKNIVYEKEKFQMLQNFAIASLAIIFIMSFWYRKRLNAVYADILFLYSIEKDKKNYKIFTEEIDAIYLRMRKKPTTTSNPALMDPVTGINNNKGLFTSYSEKKGLKESNFTSVTVIEIDNFSKTNRAFPQELTQAILKKVAFTISLHEQATDVIARTDYNQFTIILSRASKEQAFKDIEMIRQSIAEIKFKLQNKESASITVSGGFVIKPNNKQLEESMKQAKRILEYTQTTGKNKIFQTRDLIEV